MKLPCLQSANYDVTLSAVCLSKLECDVTSSAVCLSKIQQDVTLSVTLPLWEKVWYYIVCSLPL